MNMYTMWAIVAFAFFGQLVLRNYDNNSVKTEAIKAGLEQCAFDPDGPHLIIWVKDCKSFIEMQKKLEYKK